MNIDMIEKVVKRVENSHVYQVTVEDGNQAITVTNRLNSVNHHVASPSATTPQSTQTSTDTKEPAHTINASFVGFVQLGADSGDTLVQQGDTIEMGQTVAYIDVLSKLHPVTSDKAGVVEAVLVQSGDGVEYGQPIIRLKN